MDANMQSRSPDDSDGKPSFRRPSNDAGNRKYRRHSPVNESVSSPSGSPKHGRSPSPTIYRENRTKTSDDSRIRKGDGRESQTDSGRSRPDKGDDDSHKLSERHSYGRSRNCPRDDEYSGYHRHADGEKSYKRSSWSGRETKSSTYSDYTRRDSKADRSREYWRDADKYSRDKPDEFHRSKDKEGDTSVLERHKHKEKHSSSDRATSDKTVERERHNRDRGGGRDDTRDSRRSMGEYKNDHTSSSGEGKYSIKGKDSGGGRDDTRDSRRSMGEYKNDHTSSSGEGKYSIKGKDSGGGRLKESYRINTKELDGQNAETVEKRKPNEAESDRLKGRYHTESDRSFSYRDRDGRKEQYQVKTSNEDHESSAKKMKSNSDSDTCYVKDRQPVSKSASVADESLLSNSKQAQNAVAKSAQAGNEADAADGLNAAKVAAMRAAELVNKNLIGGGYMSTDQKKKLLWGSKKNTAPEESGHRWDISLFSDRERQEKFNKLMGVKGEVKPPEQNNPKDELQAEKQEQLQLDLEKQYTAGLRRRDGRTVGLGL